MQLTMEWQTDLLRAGRTLSSRAMGYQFKPLAIEVFGRFGKHFSTVLRSLASRALASLADDDRAVLNKLHASLIHLWQMKISCCLQNGNARIIQMGAFRIANRGQSSGNAINFNSLQESLICR